MVTVAILPDSRVKALNRLYRGINTATDVLSFPGSGWGLQPDARKPLPTPFLGDIAIARGIAQKQAKLFGHSLGVEFRVLALHGLLHLLGYDHESDSGRMARAETRLRRKAGLPPGLIARSQLTSTMIPLILFLLACCAIYLGTIQAAFNALMRVSLRLLAEGSGRAPDLERYLQEPLLLFLPLRTLLGLIEGFIVLLLAMMIGVSGPGALLLLAGSMVPSVRSASS